MSDSERVHFCNIMFMFATSAAGFALRKDDPSSLKEFIVVIQGKAAQTDTTKFVDQ